MLSFSRVALLFVSLHLVFGHATITTFNFCLLLFSIHLLPPLDHNCGSSRDRDLLGKCVACGLTSLPLKDFDCTQLISRRSTRPSRVEMLPPRTNLIDPTHQDQDSNEDFNPDDFLKLPFNCNWTCSFSAPITKCLASHFIERPSKLFFSCISVRLVSFSFFVRFLTSCVSCVVFVDRYSSFLS